MLACVVLLLASAASAAPASAVRPDLAKPISGTRCSEFPADNWWHADVSQLPVHARSAAWLSHMSTGVDLHPDFGPSYGDGPNYGIPITVVGKKHAKSKVRFDYSSESDHVKYPLGRDTKIEGGRSSDGDRHAIIVDKDKCKLYELYATSFSERALARRLRRGLVAEEEQAAPRRLDLRRRRRAADPARAAAVERGQEEPDRPRHPVHHRRDLAGPSVAGPA